MSDETPRLGDAEVEELLGAYALDACEPDEVALIEAALARRPDLAHEAEELARVAAWLGATEAHEAPAGLRSRVLSSTAVRRDPVVDLYVTECDHFQEAVELLADAELGVRTANGLTARELVAHAAAQESLLAQLVGTPTMPDIDEPDIERRTAHVVAALADRPLDDVVRAWRDAVDANARWADDARDDVTTWRGVPLARHDAIVVRAFETWVHANDLRRVAGVPERVPADRHLALMTDLAGRSLGISLALAERLRPGRTACLVLRGTGGGVWLVDMGGDVPTPGVHADVTLTADAVEWCRLVGDRVAPGELACEVEGDAGLAHDLLEAAPALATL